MKVYVVSAGCRYEGGSVHSVHADIESARHTVASLLKDEACEIEEFRKEDSWWNDSRFDYTEESPDFWANNSNFISIDEYRVISTSKP